MTELNEILDFTQGKHISDHIPEMEHGLERAIAYRARIGTMLNLAEAEYRKKCATVINNVTRDEEMTEVLRKIKVEAETADDKREVQDFKALATHLKAIEMMLFQAIKTRRSEI